MTAPRRRWSFGLRTLFALVTVFGCWLAWERHIVNGRAEVRQAIEKAGGIFYTGESLPGPFPRPGPKPPSWIRRQFGDESVGLIDVWGKKYDAKLVQSWFPEAELCPTPDYEADQP